MKVFKISLIIIVSLMSCKKQGNGGGESDRKNKKISQQKIVETEEEYSGASAQRTARYKSELILRENNMTEKLISMKQAKNEKNADLADSLMKSFLDAWNPIGKTKRELKESLGDPDRSEPSSSSYILDSGYGGWEWKFVFEGEKITRFERVGLN